MKLSSTLLHSSGKLLLLLVSNFLLWENTAADSQHMCEVRNGKCFMSVRSLFDRAVMVSQYLNFKSAELFTECYKEYAHRQGFLQRVFNNCPTANITTPENQEQAKQMHPDALLKVIINILEAWNQTLEYLVTEMGGMQEVPKSILTSVENIDHKYKGLLEGMNTIKRRVRTNYDEELSMPSELGEESLDISNEETRLSALYNLFHCLRIDSNKISTFIMLLRCRIVYPNDC